MTMRTIGRTFLFAAAMILLATAAPAAIRRDPNGVNVNSQGPTTVFITFGGLLDQIPVEAFWCGELISAAPDIGQKCDPATLFGRLPLRYDQSRLSGSSVFTDIMSIPTNVARRAYEAAAAGRTSSFFYVRRFASTTGGPDEYVFVTCRMAGMGARTPLALTDVQVRFDVESTVMVVRPGEIAPASYADIHYNGTGWLQGRWEIVLPGDEPPTREDLLTEATLPVELRGTQRKYTQLERFSIFLPPTGRVRLQGPSREKLPTAVEGLYQIVLRVEASNDKESDSNLAAAGAGTGVVHSGGVAGFPMPPLRYYVATSGTVIGEEGMQLQLLTPLAKEVVHAGEPLQFHWTRGPEGAFFRLELKDANESEVLSAILDAGARSYRAPSWLAQSVAPGALHWRVVALAINGDVIGSTAWRDLNYGPPADPAGESAVNH
jgi:hypothetical protein